MLNNILLFDGENKDNAQIFRIFATSTGSKH